MSAATLNSLRATSARVSLPAWGCWYAEVSLDGEHALAGPVTLQIADLTLKGTILSGGPAKGRSDFRVVAGAGGWGRSLKALAYATDAGVKVSTVLTDAASAVGETIATVDAALRTGPEFVRPDGPASRVLEMTSPRSWYVDEAGVTHLGKRAAVAFTGIATRVTPADLSRRTVTLAAEQIAKLLPGAIVDGLEAVDVHHSIDSKGGLRTELWGSLAGGSSRTLEAFRKILDQIDPDRAFRGVTEYRVVTTSGKRLNLQPIRVSTGMPELRNVPAMPGVGGCDTDPALGSRVLVGFVDSDPGRPVVLAYEDAEGAGFVPITLTLLKGTQGVARVGDTISISTAQITAALMVAGGNPVSAGNALQGTIATGSTKVKAA
jgi:hypothetical protein